MTIFDMIKSEDIVGYWETMTQNRAPYMLENIFPADKKLGLDLSYIKGSAGLPCVLNASAFDVQAIPRERIGFDRLSAKMPYFKESMYIDEELRQELNMVLQTGNQVYIDTIMNRIFSDEVQLIESAAVTRERMRAMALTTGAVALSSNGQAYSYDYQVPSNHKYTEKTFNDKDFDICTYITDVCDDIETDTGVRPTKAIVSRSQWNKIKSNEFMAKNIYVLTNGVGNVTDAMAKKYLEDNTGVIFEVYSKKYKDESRETKAFIPDDTIVLYPDGDLGKTWFGTTPEESDLMSGSTASVSITDTGVAVTTIKQPDPVNVETKVSMICLPSFEMADQIAIIDTSSAD